MEIGARKADQAQIAAAVDADPQLVPIQRCLREQQAGDDRSASREPRRLAVSHPHGPAPLSAVSSVETLWRIMSI